MKGLYPLKGIVTVLNTPFTEDNTLDLAGLKKHLHYAIGAGVRGILVPAMASEVYKLSDKERQSMVETTLAISDASVTVIGGAGETDITRRKKIVKDLLDIGCKNILLQIPFQSKDPFIADVCRIAEMGPDMIMIQDWDPGNDGLPLDVIVELFETVDAFRCLKIETVPAGPKYSRVLEATDGRLHVSGGWAVMTMMEALARGVHAFMPTGLHEVYCLIYKLYNAGQVDEARQWFNRLLPVISFSNQHLDISIHFFKRLLQRQGIYNTDRVREPIMAFDLLHKETADPLIAYAMELMTEAQSISDSIGDSAK